MLHSERAAQGRPPEASSLGGASGGRRPARPPTRRGSPQGGATSLPAGNGRPGITLVPPHLAATVCGTAAACGTPAAGHSPSAHRSTPAAASDARMAAGLRLGRARCGQPMGPAAPHTELTTQHTAPRPQTPCVGDAALLHACTQSVMESPFGIPGLVAGCVRSCVGAPFQKTRLLLVSGDAPVHHRVGKTLHWRMNSEVHVAKPYVKVHLAQLPRFMLAPRTEPPLRAAPASRTLARGPSESHQSGRASRELTPDAQTRSWPGGEAEGLRGAVAQIGRSGLASILREHGIP